MTAAIVSGALATRYLNGGGAWTRLNWALGLKKLGFQVWFIEQIGRGSCVDATGAVTAFEKCVNVPYFEEVCKQFGLWGSAALVYENGEQTHGLSYAELVEVAQAAALLVNLSGHLTLEPLKGRRCHKVYLDGDPGFTQFWHAAGNPGPRLAGHDFYFTVGGNVGTPGCPIPTGDIPWRRTSPPVVLGHWPVSAASDRGRFTTVASWRGPYGPVQYGGQTYGLKVHEFRKVVELPERVRQTFEIALNIHPADEKDRDLLRRHGWKIVDPKVAVPEPGAYRRYVQTSGAEFSVAQGVYVQTGSGWFSDRTVCYLASGKPALVQDTGFSRHYPVGEGLVPFQTLEQAVEGAERILCDYDRHCQAARVLAEAYFDSDKVLGRVLEEVGVAV
jgi:hypothetical protein